MDIGELTKTEHKLYIMAGEEFENGQTYQNLKHTIKKQLKEDYAMLKVNNYRHYNKYPKTHHFREDYDELIKNWDVKYKR